jgi:hypothetical protein
MVPMSNLMTESQGPPIQAQPKRRWYLRPWFIISAVLVVAAAIAITVVASLPQTITVRGSVLDRLRPDLGVAAATLTADGTTDKTGANGAFTMAGVPANANLQVRAPNYEPATVTASDKLMTIRLTPIPVDVTVTSAMTGDKVKAAVSAPPGEPEVYTIASGSTLHLYRAGPGDKVTVTADGYRAAHPAVSTGRTLTVAMEPTQLTLMSQLAVWYTQGKYEKMVDWLLRPATGYTFVPLTAQEQAKANKMINPEFEVHRTWRTITSSNAMVHVTITKPGVTINGPKWAQASVGHATHLTIAGKPAWHGGPSPEFGDYGTMMQVGPYLVAVYGSSLQETDQIMTDIMNTLLGPSAVTAALK